MSHQISQSASSKPWRARSVLASALLITLSLLGEARAQAPVTSPPTGLSGYMEFHFNKDEFSDGVLDLHRFVLLVTHAFSDRLRFVGELELEHALVEGLEEAGELELEQAYLDFLIRPSFNVRAGMLLVPVGIINERHEPPVFFGVERPLVDTVIIPSTWFETGAGVHGELARGWRYRAYVMAPLNAAEFDAEEGVRNGRQKGSQSNVGRVALTGRVEYAGRRGLTAGASFWSGRSGFEFRPAFDVPVNIQEADVRFSRGRLDLRGQFARVDIANADRLNDIMGQHTGVSPNVARTLRGFYLESGYRVLSGRAGDVAVFTRYENVDTQFRMPDGYVPLKEFDRDAWVIGGTFWPDPDVAIKFDYTILSDQSQLPAPNAIAAGLGWWF